MSSRERDNLESVERGAAPYNTLAPLDETLIEEAFRAIDENGNGTLSQEEFADAIRRLRLPLNAAEMDALFHRIGSNEQISWTQFRDFVHAKHANLRKSFERLDASRDGRLDPREITEALRELGLPCNDKTVAKMMRRVDAGEG